ncbi:MAG: hypothetical protein IPM42_17110 [Saprospiraceae bacterium]|nr:hypothetical protein [Saprospiraceae bacterium]
MQKKLNEILSLKKSSAKNQINKGLKIGILFNGTEEENRKTVHRFKKSLSEGMRTITSLAFIDNKLPLDNIDYAAYNLKNINWYGMPSGEKIDSFAENKFDILFILSEKMYPHFEYIIALTHSELLVGPNINGSEKYFNFIADISNTGKLPDLINGIMQSLQKVSMP